MWENFFGKTTDTRLEMRARSKEIDALKFAAFWHRRCSLW
jgi:hypothetical protein